MMRKLAVSLLATTATAGAFMLAVPAAHATTSSTASATADVPNYDVSWGVDVSSNQRASAHGRINVKGESDDGADRVAVSGRLYDADHRTYEQGGKCAYVRFEMTGRGIYGEWSDRKNYKYCGAGGFKSFSFTKKYVNSISAQVCQVDQNSSYPTKCGEWNAFYTARSL